MYEGLVCFKYFFFQAEDGIRDLVRSRGLGDVYKRQGANWPMWTPTGRTAPSVNPADPWTLSSGLDGARAVSYTHLTLPTSDLV